jgi:hypothetical protein
VAYLRKASAQQSIQRRGDAKTRTIAIPCKIPQSGRATEKRRKSKTKDPREPTIRSHNAKYNEYSSDLEYKGEGKPRLGSTCLLRKIVPERPEHVGLL